MTPAEFTNALRKACGEKVNDFRTLLIPLQKVFREKSKEYTDNNPGSDLNKMQNEVLKSLIGRIETTYGIANKSTPKKDVLETAISLFEEAMKLEQAHNQEIESFQYLDLGDVSEPDSFESDFNPEDTQEHDPEVEEFLNQQRMKEQLRKAQEEAKQPDSHSSSSIPGPGNSSSEE